MIGTMDIDIDIDAGAWCAVLMMCRYHHWISTGDVTPPSPGSCGRRKELCNETRANNGTCYSAQPSPAQPAQPAQPSTEQSFMLRLSCSHTSILCLAVDCRHDEQEKILEICLC